MVLTAVKRGEKIILPRNVHRSVMGAMVLGGAVPVYVNPAGDKRLGIPLGMRVEDVRRAIKENPDAKAVFVNNPTYYGICSDLRSIVKLAHEHGMLCLADEAHGTHFYFGENMPVSAMLQALLYDGLDATVTVPNIMCIAFHSSHIETAA